MLPHDNIVVPREGNLSGSMLTARPTCRSHAWTSGAYALCAAPGFPDQPGHGRISPCAKPFAVWWRSVERLLRKNKKMHGYGYFGSTAVPVRSIMAVKRRCPRCRVLKRTRFFCDELGEEHRICNHCRADPRPGKRRFIDRKPLGTHPWGLAEGYDFANLWQGRGLDPEMCPLETHAVSHGILEPERPLHTSYRAVRQAAAASGESERGDKGVHVAENTDLGVRPGCIPTSRAA